MNKTTNLLILFMTIIFLLINHFIILTREKIEQENISFKNNYFLKLNY